jgi:hypothetical protein
VNARRFRAATDQRETRAHEDMVRRDDGIRHFVNDDLFQTFAYDLFHVLGWADKQCAD